MTTTQLTLLSTLLLSLSFASCNSTKSKNLNSDAHQQATNTTPKFPSVKRPDKNVSCRNCYATFKLSMATQKQGQGHSYIACPICHKDYLKKANK